MCTVQIRSTELGSEVFRVLQEVQPLLFLCGPIVELTNQQIRSVQEYMRDNHTSIIGEHVDKSYSRWNNFFLGSPYLWSM